MNRSIAIMAALIMLAGCDQVRPPKPDQELRQKIFLACLNALPAGPQATMYNDWAEVVDSCESAAYYQSLQIGKKSQP